MILDLSVGALKYELDFLLVITAFGPNDPFGIWPLAVIDHVIQEANRLVCLLELRCQGSHLVFQALDLVHLRIIVEFGFVGHDTRL